MSTRRAFILAGVSAALFAPAVGPASAAGRQIVVALGASNTEGRGRGRTAGGVDQGQAYPAQLERLLVAAGSNARVVNAGIAGDTTDDMLARLESSVPQGTSVVVFQPGGNDERRGSGAGRSANIAEIQRKLKARGVTVIMLESFGRIAPQSTRDPDGQHFDATGHEAFARHLFPLVRAALARHAVD